MFTHSKFTLGDLYCQIHPLTMIQFTTTLVMDHTTEDILLILTSGLGLLANLATLGYILSTFNVKKSLYFILMLDSALTAASALIGFVVFVVLNFELRVRSVWTCFFMQIFDLTTHALCPVFSFIISLIRYFWLLKSEKLCIQTIVLISDSKTSKQMTQRAGLQTKL